MSSRNLFYKKPLISANTVVFFQQVAITSFGVVLGAIIVVLTVVAMKGIG